MEAGKGTTSNYTLEMFHHFIKSDGGPRVEPRWHDLMLEYEQRPFRVFYRQLLSQYTIDQTMASPPVTPQPAEPGPGVTPSPEPEYPVNTPNLSNLQKAQSGLTAHGAATAGAITHNGDRISFDVTPDTMYALFIKGPGESGYTYESNFKRSAGNPRTIHANSFNHKPGTWSIMITLSNATADSAADIYTVSVK